MESIFGSFREWRFGGASCQECSRRGPELPHYFNIMLLTGVGVAAEPTTAAHVRSYRIVVYLLAANSCDFCLEFN